MTGPFVGTIETSLVFGMLGSRIVRKLKVDYDYTPPWSYYDEQQNRECVGETRLGLRLSIWAVPRRGNDKSPFAPVPGPYWASGDQLLAVGILPRPAFEQICRRVDLEARTADGERRQSSGRPAPALPDLL